MTTFECRVLTTQEQIVTVKIEAEDKIAALKKLKRNGMTTLSIQEIQLKNIFNKKEENKKVNSVIHSKSVSKKKKLSDYVINLSNHVSIQELKEFTQDLYMLRTSNFSMEQSLKAIINNIDNIYFKKCLNKILKNILNDEFMYKVMKDYSDIFPQVYINLIRAGELSGDINDSLSHAIAYLSSQEKTINKIKEELLPSIYSFIGIIIFTVIALLVGIPTLNKMIVSNGSSIEIPKIVVYSTNIVNVIIRFWYIWLIVIFAIYKGFIYYKNTYEGRLNVDRFKYKNKFNGKITYYLDFYRVIRSVFTNIKNKMRIQDAIEMSKNTVKNTYFLSVLEDSINNVYLGKNWLEPFENEKILDPIIIEMLRKCINSKSQNLIDNTLEYIENNIEKEIDKLLKKLPIYSYLIVGIALILFMIIVLIPTIKIYLSGFLVI